MMEISGCLEAGTELKDVWKYVTELLGALSAMTPGAALMLKLYATS